MKNWIEITTIIGCKNMCIYCPQDKLLKSYKDSKKIMTLDDFKKILNNINPDNTQITFSGYGEPFLAPDAEDMMIEAYKRGYEIFLYTTLVGFTNEKRKKLSNSGVVFGHVYFHEYNGKNFNLEKFNDKKEKFKQDIKSLEYVDIKIDYPAARAGNMWEVPKKKGSVKCDSNRYYSNVCLPNGDLYLCCNDWTLKHKIGNMFENHYDSFNDKRLEIIDLCTNEDSDVICRYCEESNPYKNEQPYRKHINNMKKKFLVGPRLGDLLHSLYIIKDLSDGQKCDVYVTDNVPFMGNHFSLGFENTYNDIYPIISKLPYINRFLKYENEIDDIIDLRTFNINYTYLYKVNWYESFHNLYDTSDKFKNEAWLDEIKDNNYKSYENKVVINFSDGRYDDNYDQLLENIIKNNDCIFITTKGDFRGYDKFKFKSLLKIKECESFSEMYSIIEYCKFFVGNQTMPLALAHGLFKPHLGFLYKNDAIHYKDNYNTKYFWIDQKKRISGNFNNIYNYINLYKMEIEPVIIDYSNIIFNIDYDFDNDRVSISCNGEVEVSILIYEIDSVNNQRMINCNYAKFNRSSGWFGNANPKLMKDMYSIKVEISDDEIILAEDLKIIKNEKYMIKNNPTFYIKYEFSDDKIYISCDSKIKCDVLIYNIKNKNILHHGDIDFNKNIIWFSNIKQNDVVKIEIKHNNDILKEQTLVINNIVKKQSTISLSIIVKDEAKTIISMLESVYPILDYYVVVDTGSSDKTQEIIREFFKDKGISGEVIESPFKNYGYARNVALKAVKDKADYGFWIDADDKLIINPKLNIKEFKYNLSEYDGMNFYQVNKFQYFSDDQFHENTISGNKLTFLFSTTKSWRWWGPVHEVLICDDVANVGETNDILILKHDVGDTWNQGGQKKYENYAKILEEHLKEDYNSRWVFYAAQCYLDAGGEENIKKAYNWYDKRISMQGYWEETYYSLFKIAEIKARLNYPIYDVIDSYLKCSKANIYRIEHLIPVIEYYQSIKEYHIAYIYTSYVMKYAGKSPTPNSSLFIDSSVYNWKIYDLHNISCWYSGRIDEAKETFKKLWEQVEKGLVPNEELVRITDNKKYNM